LQNHENRPTGSAPLPEVKATSSHFGGRGRGRGRGRGSGRNRNFFRPRNNNSMKWQNPDTKQPKHLVDLYQTSLKEKGKQIETNFIGHCDPLETTQSDIVLMGITHLDIADFVTDPNEKMN
ncbi:hypothetical protein CFOL_v3_00799, partial [Cephalotus follicularis]